jgi:type VI protein secretion system component Hcp
MTKNQNVGGNMLVRVFLGAAIIVLMASTPLFLTSTAWAADAGYLRIIGAGGAIDGGSKDAAHANWIVVSSVVAGDLNGDAKADAASGQASGKAASDSWSTPTGKAAIGSSTSGAGAGKVTASDAASGMASGKRQHQPFTIRKEVDSASPLLFKACASGQHFKEVDVDLGNGARYTLTDVVISSINKSSGGDRPTESVSFTYQKIEMSR